MLLYGSVHKSYFQMLDPVHNQGLRLCLGALRTFPVESVYMNLVWELDMQCYLCSMLPRSSHCLNILHDAVFDTKYMKLFYAMLNATHIFGLHIKQFLSAFNIDFLDILETPSFFVLTP